MQIGEGVDTRKPAAPTNRVPVKVRVTLLFDGTGNNRVNTKHREQNDWTYWWMRHAVPGKTDSYENDYSNVARLAENLEDKAPPYDAYVRVYTEGIGTVDGDTDERVGLGTGTGFTGVVSKVTKGIAAAVAEITKRYSPKRFVVEQIAVDTCGFSRGAAAARHCVYRVLNDRKSRLQVQLEAAGFHVGEVEVLAVGLFDTVSSYGVSRAAAFDSAYDDNVHVLHLDAIAQAKAVYQLAAAEEFRERFSLTNIDSAGGKGRQVYLPGAHSDIGGGYRDGASEDQTLVEGPAASDIFAFMRDRGWYHPDRRELSYSPGYSGTYVPYGGSTADVPPSVTANRAAIARAYTFIPLGLMADFLKRQAIPVKRAKLDAAYDAEDVPGRTRIVSYAQRIGLPGASPPEAVSRPGDWDDNRFTDVQQLRHDYLHVSFRVELGMGVRVVTVPGTNSPQYRPYRLVYHG